FREDWIVPTLDIPLPSRLRLYGASDFAVSSKESADYTVHVVLGLDSQLRLYLVDLWRRRGSSAEWVGSLCGMVERWPPGAGAPEKRGAVAARRRAVRGPARSAGTAP